MNVPRPGRRLALHVIGDLSLKQSAREFEQGVRPARFPYGMERLEHHGIDLVESPRWARHKLVDVVEHRSGIRLDPLRAWPTARRADATLAMWEHWGELPSLLTHVPGPYRDKPLYTVVCWAAEDLRSGDARDVARVRRILDGSDLVFFLSRNQQAVFLAHGARPEQLVPITFGIATRFFQADPAAERDVDILAVGIDRGRDYRTLARAVAGTDLNVQMLTTPERARAAGVPESVGILGVLRADHYRDLLQRAKVVVVPTHDLAYPTGQTVAMDAAAAGCAVVVSHTTAMAEYFTDGLTARMPPVGDADRLRDALADLLSAPEDRVALARRGQAHVLSSHTSDVMWEQVAAAVTAHAG